MQAIIIAGGEGQRLRPLTDDRPKGMVALAGKPILQHQIEWLRDNGVTEAVIACGYLHQVIEEYFGDGDGFGMRIRYSIEAQPLGRGGALKLAYRQLDPDDPYTIATNGDNVQTQPLGPMISQHKRSGAVATIMLVQLRSPYGIVRQKGSRVVGFLEKPLLPNWLNAGMYILNREFFAPLPEIGDHEDGLFPQLASEGKLYAFRSKSYWKAIDTIKDLGEAEKELTKAAAK